MLVLFKKICKKILNIMGYDIKKLPSTTSQVTKKPLVPGMVIATDHVTLPAIGIKKGNFLLSYILDPFVDPAFDGKNNGWGHTNVWECYTIATILQNLDFEVDVIDYRNVNFKIDKEYNFFLDISTTQQKLVSKYNMKSKNILYLTGASNPFQNNAELVRVSEFERNKKTYYQPKRIVSEIALFNRALNMADELILLGNEWTKSTYPEEYHHKITLAPVSSALTYIKKENYIPKEKSFLFYSGSGAVHKGLDLILDFFIKNPQYKLHVCGSATDELDFMRVYEEELKECSNIIIHGWCLPNSDNMQKIIQECFCFISPSCSEGMSTATTTVLSMGLFPIISIQNGIDLPPNAGLYLSHLTETCLAEAVNKVYNMKEDELVRQIIACQSMAIQNYSRDAFRNQMNTIFQKIICN